MRNTPRTTEGKKPGTFTAFPFDRMTVERFREAFPRARWSDEKRAWFVPGKMAGRRVNRWLARESEMALPYADARGRDAYAFEPIESSYLEAADDLRIRTPYSTTVVEQMRAIPWARWDDELRAWRVPFRSYEELRRRWETIEAAGRRNEPAARMRRLQERKNSLSYKAAQLRQSERRRRRYPVQAENLPPLNRPLMTVEYGIVIFAEIGGELADPAAITSFYPLADPATFTYVWASWRRPRLAELVATWPAKQQPDTSNRARGWWQPTLSELRAARRQARSAERRKRHVAAGP